MKYYRFNFCFRGSFSDAELTKLVCLCVFVCICVLVCLYALVFVVEVLMCPYVLILQVLRSTNV